MSLAATSDQSFNQVTDVELQLVPNSLDSFVESVLIGQTQPTKRLPAVGFVCDVTQLYDWL